KEYEIAFDYQHGTIMLLNKINEEKDGKEEQDNLKLRHYKLEIQRSHHWKCTFIFNGTMILTILPIALSGHVSFLIVLGISVQMILLRGSICQISVQLDKIIYYIASVYIHFIC
ncbi:hypothetical protein RFI_36701, partial [Reticulomyxa filosa]